MLEIEGVGEATADGLQDFNGFVNDLQANSALGRTAMANGLGWIIVCRIGRIGDSGEFRKANLAR